MGLFPYDLQKYALSGKMTRIKVVGVYLYKGLSLNIEGHLKVNIEFLNGNPPFQPWIWKGREIFRYVVMLVVKVTSRDHLEVKLVTVTEYAVEDNIEKNDSNKSCRGYEGLSFSDLDFEFDLEIDLGTDSAS